MYKISCKHFFLRNLLVLFRVANRASINRWQILPYFKINVQLLQLIINSPYIRYSEVCGDLVLYGAICIQLAQVLNNTYYSQSSFLISFASLTMMIRILCLFVQRLSTTVKMVAKGVLKDHLILVANSMTCTGNLYGFNTGGYKATFRSLKVQVPFTVSTLFVSLYLKYLVRIQ